MSEQSCKASPATCGTPSGWRMGGRCPRCRAAHNEETARARRARNAPPPDVVDAYAAQLEAGVDPTVAARSLGIHSARARALGKDHPRIAAALADPTAPHQRAVVSERQADYLKALIDCGAVTAACRSAEVTDAGVSHWRRDKEFAAAEQALRTWRVTRPTPVARPKWSKSEKPQYDRVLALLADPTESIAGAARKAGLAPAKVTYRARRDADFKAQLDRLRPPGSRSYQVRQPRVLIDGDWLRQQWFNKDVSMKDLARAVGLTEAQLRIRAARLGLPTKRQAALKEIR